MKKLSKLSLSLIMVHGSLITVPLVLCSWLFSSLFSSTELLSSFLLKYISYTKAPTLSHLLQIISKTTFLTNISISSSNNFSISLCNFATFCISLFIMCFISLILSNSFFDTFSIFNYKKFNL